MTWRVLQLQIFLAYNVIICGKIMHRSSGGYDSEEQKLQLGEKVILKDGELSEIYTESITNILEYHYTFQMDISIDPPFAVRLKSEIVDNSSEEAPILFTVRTSKGTMNWNLPYKAKNIKYPSMERTLCLVDETDFVKNIKMKTEEVKVLISTKRETPVTVQISLEPVHHFSAWIHGNAPSVRKVSVTTPVYYFIDLQNFAKDSLLQVKVNSGDNTCGLISMQRFLCPVYDIQDMAKAGHVGTFQTMQKRAAFNYDLQSENLQDQGHNVPGAFMIFMVLDDDSACGSNNETYLGREKTFHYEINDPYSKRQLTFEIIGSIVLMIVLGLFAAVVTLYFSVYDEKGLNLKIEKLRENGSRSKAVTGDNLSLHMHDAMISQNTHSNNFAPTTMEDISRKKGPVVHVRVSEDGRDVISMEENEYANSQFEERLAVENDITHNIDQMDNVGQFQHNFLNVQTNVTTAASHEVEFPMYSKPPKYATELSQKYTKVGNDKKYKDMFKKSDLYIYMVIMMGVFYGIPALQVVINFQQTQDENQDTCYYNFLCSISVGNVTDFNHIFSNMYYMGFGLLFLVLVLSKKQKHLKLLERMDEEGLGDEVQHFGIHQQYGIFYAMGWALIFEGVFSACYHVCPTNENFQFDTTFMYVIAILCFIKIYQFRHPDVSSNAYKAFLGIGLVMLLEALGIFYESTLFWAMLLLIYFFATQLLVILLYQAGKLSFRPSNMKKVLGNVAMDMKSCNCESFSRKRLIFVSILEGVNLIFIVYGAVTSPNISTYLLFIFITNLLVYTVYYISMKTYHKEKIRGPPIVYSILAVLCWVPALYFFTAIKSSSLVTPAESRNLNEECAVLDLYDNHDIWHIFSAGGLFFSYMMILTLDDGLFYTRREEIHIF